MKTLFCVTASAVSCTVPEQVKVAGKDFKNVTALAGSLQLVYENAKE